jgi:peptidoglycan/LPS O-acetylase OafA/YrhL
MLVVPLAGLALRRRWGAYVLGGFLAVAAVMLVPQLFVPFSDLVSISQSRRAAGFWPLAFAFAGGLTVLAALLRRVLLAAALAAGIALQVAYPGEFSYKLEDGGPALVTWFAVAGGLAALAYGLWRKPDVERSTSLVAWAAALFVLPVAVHAAADWSPNDARKPSALTPGLVDALREQVPEGDVVYSDPETSYEIAAYAPVYIVVAPPGHVADTEENRPYERRDEAQQFLETGDVAIPQRAGADWLVLDRDRYEITPDLDSVYRDDRYTLYTVP